MITRRERDLARMEAMLSQHEPVWREHWHAWTHAIGEHGAQEIHQRTSDKTFYHLVQAMAHMLNARWTMQQQQELVLEQHLNGGNHKGQDECYRHREG